MRSIKKKCWNAQIGNKKTILCNTDEVSKRMIVKKDVYDILNGCKEVLIDDRKRVTYVYPDAIEDAVQRGRVKSIKCQRRVGSKDCWVSDLMGERVPMCRDDPTTKKIEIMDAVDISLGGCSKARMFTPDGGRFSMKKVGGLSINQRKIIARWVVSGDVRRYRCAKKTSRREKSEDWEEDYEVTSG
jgi:hypothetical protein